MKYFWREELRTIPPPTHTHWMSHNKVRQQRKHLNLVCELYQHSHVVFYRTSSANYNVSQIKLDCLIHLRTLQKNSVILLENETTTIVMDVTILPHVYTRHSSPVLELWRHHYSQFASVMKSQERWEITKWIRLESYHDTEATCKPIAHEEIINPICNKCLCAMSSIRRGCTHSSKSLTFPHGEGGGRLGSGLGFAMKDTWGMNLRFSCFGLPIIYSQYKQEKSHRKYAEINQLTTLF